MFANGIDSDNLGEGVWAWGLRSAMSNLGFGSNYSAYFNYVHNTQGAQYIIIKAADGGNVYNNPAGSQSYTTTVRNAAHAAGLKILPYFYIRGTTDATVTAEINVFNSIVDSVGADGVVFDIEGDWAGHVSPNPVDPVVRDQRIVDYFAGIEKSQAGDGSGSRDTMFMAYSSFPYVSLHSEVPFLKLGDYCDASMPQPYWYTLSNSPSSSSCRSPTKGQTLRGPGGQQRMVKDVDSEYRMMSLESTPRANIWNNHPESIKPVIMTGQMYTTAMPASEITEFYNAVINDTTAVGSGNVAGYKYKSINFFDEDTAGVTTQAQLDALNTLSIGDLPGTPASPSPGNNVTVASPNPVTLDWADVLNTYGSPSTGAATSYDVYIDGVFKANVTSSTYSVSPSLASGLHTWQIRANDIIGTTNGPTWSFYVNVAAPSALALSNVTENSISLSWADNSANESQFLIERKLGAAGTYAQIGTASSDATSYVDNGAGAPQPGGTYFYRVRAWDGTTVYSSYATEQSATTLAAVPTGLSASDGAFNNKIALSWSASTGAAKYQVYRSTTNNVATASALGSPIVATGLDDASASPNTTYFYWIAGVNSANVAGNKSAVDSGFIDGIAPTAAPGGFQSNVGPTYIDFVFSEPVGASIDSGDLSFTNLDSPGGAVPNVASASWISASSTARYFLTNPLPDANFRAMISGVNDPAGNALAGANTQDFSFLTGDASGDRIVNALDFNALASHFGASGAGFSGGDFNFDGVVNSLDFNALATRFGTSLPPLAPGALPAPALASLFSAVTVKQANVLDPANLDELPA